VQLIRSAREAAGVDDPDEVTQLAQVHYGSFQFAEFEPDQYTRIAGIDKRGVKR
jgi:hypothetical protein